MDSCGTPDAAAGLLWSRRSTNWLASKSTTATLSIAMIQRSTFLRCRRETGLTATAGSTLTSQSLRCDLVIPGKQDPKRESHRRRENNPTHDPLGDVEEWKDLRSDLHQEPRARRVECSRAQDVAPLQLSEEVAVAHFDYGRSYQEALRCTVRLFSTGEDRLGFVLRR